MHFDKNNLRTLILIALIALSSARAFAQVEIRDEEEGSVVVESADDLTASYKDRRTRHGALIGFHAEDYYPFNYQTQTDGQIYIEDIIGEEPIRLYGIEAGYKMNISIGSAAILLNYSLGEATGLSVGRVALAGNIALDGLFDEPYVVPYAQAGVYQMQFIEESETESKSGSSGPAISYKLGALLQLDWIEAKADPGAKIERLRSSGLENTFIDIYYSEHLPSSNAQDAEVFDPNGEINTASTGQIGLGLKIEF